MLAKDLKQVINLTYRSIIDYVNGRPCHSQFRKLGHIELPYQL